MSEIVPELTVKEQYEDCKGSECPRLRPLMKERDGKYYVSEGGMAYYVMVLCNNWSIGIGDGNCPIKPIESEDQEPVS